MNENTMNPTTSRKAQTIGSYRPKLALYHPNVKGTGCAIQMELHPAHNDMDGCIMLKAANQLTIGDRRAPTPQFPRFDWKKAINVKLDFNDLCMMLQVFRGECETINEGRGLYHQSAIGTTRIVLRHLLEPICGYSLELYRTQRSGEGETRTHFLFSTSEALGLMEAISGSMSIICFGIPMQVEHAQARQTATEMRNANASAA